MAVPGSYLELQLKRRVLWPIVVYRECVFREVLPVFSNLSERAERVSDEYVNEKYAVAIDSLLDQWGDALRRSVHDHSALAKRDCHQTETNCKPKTMPISHQSKIDMQMVLLCVTYASRRSARRTDRREGWGWLRFPT